MPRVWTFILHSTQVINNNSETGAWTPYDAWNWNIGTMDIFFENYLHKEKSYKIQQRNKQLSITKGQIGAHARVRINLARVN